MINIAKKKIWVAGHNGMVGSAIVRKLIKEDCNVIKANNFNEAIRKITSTDKKLIICIGSLYNVGNILNKN